MDIIQILKSIRLNLKINQKELASLMGANLKRVENLENGNAKHLKPEEVEKIVALGFSRSWLLTGEGKMLASDKKVIEFSDQDMQLIKIVIVEADKTFKKMGKNLNIEDLTDAAMMLYKIFKENFIKEGKWDGNNIDDEKIIDIKKYMHQQLELMTKVMK